jgi:hypothetical protein
MLFHTPNPNIAGFHKKRSSSSYIKIGKSTDKLTEETESSSSEPEIITKAKKSHRPLLNVD